jgi:hypothetical protein
MVLIFNMLESRIYFQLFTINHATLSRFKIHTTLCLNLDHASPKIQAYLLYTVQGETVMAVT